VLTGSMHLVGGVEEPADQQLGITQMFASEISIFLPGSGTSACR
jgi:hypothetical protein